MRGQVVDEDKRRAFDCRARYCNLIRQVIQEHAGSDRSIYIYLDNQTGTI